MMFQLDLKAIPLKCVLTNLQLEGYCFITYFYCSSRLYHYTGMLASDIHKNVTLLLYHTIFQMTTCSIIIINDLK